MKYPPSILSRIPYSLLALLILSIPLAAQDSMQRWRTFDFSKTALRQAEVNAVPLDELKLLRGIVFGRHGRIFKDAEIRVYLEAQDWYKANPAFNNSMLNNTERRNLDMIRIAEASKHTTVQPGDMRYWQTRPL